MVVQTTPFCNIDCKYCYLADRQNRARVTPSTIAAITQRIEEYQEAEEPLTWYWHAGEPLTVGIEHFRSCHEAVVSTAPVLARETQFHVQTNGILLNDTWAGFFKEYDYIVGVSIDGLRDLHDARRVTRSGGGTFDRVVSGVNALLNHGVKPAALAVVTAESLTRGREIVRSLGDLGFCNVSFNFEEIEGPHTSSSLKALDLEGSLNNAVRGFVSDILDEREARFPDMVLRETDRLVPSLLTGGSVTGLVAQPMTYVTVLADGMASTFCPELAGSDAIPRIDIHNSSFEDLAATVLDSDAYRAIRKGIESCRSTCAYFDLCGGGNPGNKWFERGSFSATETLHCRIRNQFVTEALLDYVVASDNHLIQQSQSGDC